MIRSLLVTLLVLLMVGAAAAVEAAAFVYVAVPPPACAVVSPCDPPVVFVVDTASGAVVKRFFLPIHTTPEGIAISPNGAHVYVSNRAADGFGQTSLTVIDARRHTLVASYAIGAAGKLAIRGDDSRVTPSPGVIPTDGSTIEVLIDNVVVGRPVYNNFRADIAALFPGYANSNGAVGYFIIDTRTLSNGVHTIAWVVRDSLGRAEGIGSRFFTVFNP